MRQPLVISALNSLCHVYLDEITVYKWQKTKKRKIVYEMK